MGEPKMKSGRRSLGVSGPRTSYASAAPGTSRVWVVVSAIGGLLRTVLPILTGAPPGTHRSACVDRPAHAGARPGTIARVLIRWLARGVKDVPESEDWLAPAESARLASLRFPKRRSEVRLSRWTAKLARAAALGLDDDAGTLASIEVRAAATGAPTAFLGEEPAGVAVSLTDRADCAVAPRGVA